MPGLASKNVSFPAPKSAINPVAVMLAKASPFLTKLLEIRSSGASVQHALKQRCHMAIAVVRRVLAT